MDFEGLHYSIYNSVKMGYILLYRSHRLNMANFRNMY